MTGQQRYGYVYGGTVLIKGQVRELDGTAWSLGPCDEVRLRAAAVQDLSRTESVPIRGVEILDFWYSEIVTDAVQGSPASADPFCPRDAPGTVDPFSPGSGHPCTGDF